MDTKSNTPQKIHLKDYQPSAWMIHRVELYVDLDPACTHVRSVLHLEARLHSQLPPIELNGENLKLISVKLNGSLLSEKDYTLTDKFLIVPRLLPKSTLEICTECVPAENFSMEGLYQSGTMLCTQMEAEGFRKFSYFLDRPDVLAVYTVTLKADAQKYPVLLSNGNCVQESVLKGVKTVVWKDPFPKPSYLFALVAGDLACLKGSHHTSTGRDVELRVYTDHDKADRAAYALECLKRAMRWDEQRFDLECDLDTYMIVAVDAFNAGAMENKGLNIFSASCALANPHTATDDDFSRVDSVIAHEYFHNWTGNRVTCRDWFQLTLKEGLTVLRESLYTEDMTQSDIQRIMAVRDLRNSQFVEDSGPLAHPIRPESYIEVDNFYTSTVYEKGAEVIRMMRTLIGPPLFRKGIKLYFQRYDGTAVTTEDFIKTLSEASGRDLSLFSRWYSQAGTPDLFVKDKFYPQTNVYTVSLRQTCRETPESRAKKPFPIPILLGVFDANTGKEVATDLILMQKEYYEYSINLKYNIKPVLSILRNFSAPVNVHFKQSIQDKIFLARNDTDMFNRYEAVQSAMLKELIDAVENEHYVFSKEIHQLWQLMLDRSIEKLDHPGWTALALSLPSVTQIAENFNIVDYPHIYKIRRKFFDYLCEGNLDRFDKMIQLNDTSDHEFVPTFEDASKRKLFFLAWTCRANLSKDDSVKPIYDLFQHAHQMTRKINTMLMLVENPCEYTAHALRSFYDDWKSDILVLDKWFAIQMSLKTPDILSRITELEKNLAFNPKRPGSVRALYGAFIGNKPLFHNDPQKHYPFILKRLLDIDSFNPMLACGLVKSAFSQFSKLPESNQVQIIECFKTIDATKISPNLFEVFTQINAVKF